MSAASAGTVAPLNPIANAAARSQSPAARVLRTASTERSERCDDAFSRVMPPLLPDGSCCGSAYVRNLVSKPASPRAHGMPNNQISNLARFAGPYVKSSDSTAGARSEGTFIRHALVGLVCTLGFLRVAHAMWAWGDLGHGIVCE